jgi:hypothetical protein
MDASASRRPMNGGLTRTTRASRLDLVQLELPPFSQFSPSLLLLLAVGLFAAWVWSFGLLMAGSSEVRRLPVWLWAVFLVVAPFVSGPLFLLFGAPARARRAAAVAVASAVVVTVGVIAIQQIGIWDCRTVRGSGVCEMEPRSVLLPVAVGVWAGIVAAVLVGWRRRATPTPQPLSA